MSLFLQKGDVIVFLKFLLESFHSLAKQKNIQLHFHADQDVLIMDFDPVRLHQVVSNLVHNAVKFTQEGGRIDLSAGMQPFAGESELKIKVRDNGVGIPEKDLPRLFERFYQVDGSHTDVGEGTGIGLALTKELVKLMQGDIAVKSHPGQGSEFTITLPVRQKTLEVSAVIPVRDMPLLNQVNKLPYPATLDQDDKSVVLLIEDNADVLTYFASFLQQDYQIQIGKDGQEGIEIALQLIPDLIITDVMMPLQDGFAVCQTLKNDERTSHIPIIMLSAKADLASKMEGLERGADDYLAKPFHKEELLARMRNLLRLRQKLHRHYLAAASLSEIPNTLKNSPGIDDLENIFMKKVHQIVTEQLDDPEFGVEALCKAVLLSHSQLHRKLSALTGYSANTFIRYVRLKKAKELLGNPALTIISIAYDTGFKDPSYFGRVFKQEFGVTPQAWRETVIGMNG